MEPDSEEMRRSLEDGGRWAEVCREWVMKGGEMEEVVLVGGWLVRTGMERGEKRRTYYIFTSSSHFGPVLKSSVAK